MAKNWKTCKIIIKQWKDNNMKRIKQSTYNDRNALLCILFYFIKWHYSHTSNFITSLKKRWGSLLTEGRSLKKFIKLMWLKNWLVNPELDCHIDKSESYRSLELSSDLVIFLSKISYNFYTQRSGSIIDGWFFELHDDCSLFFLWQTIKKKKSPNFNV